MISVAEADQLLARHHHRAETITVPLAEAGGHVLREEIVAGRDYPPFDRVAMDGIAIAFAGWQAGHHSFRVHSVQRAGEPPHALPGIDACIEVMTGAALPSGCDTVIRLEDLHRNADTLAVANGADVTPCRNVHARGSDRGAGAVILRAGTQLLPPHVAVLAAEGRAEVRVAARPRIALVCTGDELVGVEASVLPHQIRQTNGHALRAALVQHGYPDVSLAQVPDDESILQARLSDALRDADVLVLTGGVSAGQFDLVPAILGGLGVETVFHKVRQKPGKPLWFGASPRGQAVFGLPGNPVSALVGLYRYVLPFLAASAGVAVAPRSALLTRLPKRNNDFTLFVPVRLEGVAAHPVPSNGSGDFLSLLPSEGFVEVGPMVTEPGPVPFYPWRPA